MVLNDDYTLTVEFTDGTSWTSDEPLMGANADWEAAEGEPGYILNKVPLVKGNGVGSVQGSFSKADGDYSSAIGYATIASGFGAHSEGSYSNSRIYLTGEANAVTYTVAREIASRNIKEYLSHAVGYISYNNVSGTITAVSDDMTRITLNRTLSQTALNDVQVIFGMPSFAKGEAAHAEGVSMSVGLASHSEGYLTKTLNLYSHAEGRTSTASGIVSHAEGYSTEASGSFSHSEGYSTIANHKSQHVFGEANVEDPSTEAATARGTYVEIVGNGASATARSNARTLDWLGNQWLAGNLKVGGTSYDDPNAKEVATKEYVNNIVPDTLITYVHLTETYDSNAGKTIYTADMTATEIQAALSNGPVVVLYNGKEHYLDSLSVEITIFKFIRIDPYNLANNTNIVTALTLYRRSNTWTVTTYKQKVPDENIKIISGTWTTPTSGNPYMDYDDSLMNDNALTELLNDGESVTLKVDFPDVNGETDTRYFYLKGKTTGQEAGDSVEGFIFWSMPSVGETGDTNYASLLYLMHNSSTYAWAYREIPFPVKGVTVNGTSVVGQNGVADIAIATPNWKAAEGEDGYIENRPQIYKGTARGSLQNTAIDAVNATGMNAIALGFDSYAFTLNITGDANSTVYSYSPEISELRARFIKAKAAYISIGIPSNIYKSAIKILDIDTESKTITLDATLSEESALSNQSAYVFIHAVSSGVGSFTSGYVNIASGNASTALGTSTIASGNSSATFGASTVASGLNSVAFGNNTASNHKSQYVFGEYNIEDINTATATKRGDYVEIVGNGTADDARSNARTLDWSGNQWLAGDLKLGGTGYDDPNAKTVATMNDFPVQYIKLSLYENPDTGEQSIVANLTDEEVWELAQNNTTTPVYLGECYSFVSKYSGSLNYIITYKHLDAFNGAVKILTLSKNNNTNDISWHYSTENVPYATDVTVNGTSVVNNGVAEIPVASANDLGVVKIGDTSNGIASLNGELMVACALTANIKQGVAANRPIAPLHQHESTFYGLAKAAGDTTQASSDNAVGTYTDNAKAAIKAMLGVTDGIDPETITVTGTDPVITGVPNARYICGEVYSLSITPPSGGIIDVIFTSGTTVTVLTLPNTVRLPEWWEGPEAGYTYEICITDGTYAVITSWPVA